MMKRKRSTPKQAREAARNAKSAFNRSYREGAMGFRNSSEGVGDGGEDLGPTKSDYGVGPGDVVNERDKKPWADGSEAESGYKMGEGDLDEALKRTGFKLAFKNRAGGKTYENEAGHRVFVKGWEAYSKWKDGAKQYYANESEFEAAHGKRESVRTFMKRYLRG